MTEQELQQMEERANAATSGPWWTDKRAIWVIGQMYYNAYVTTDEADIAGLGAEDICHADAKFIAHARADVPALIAEVRSLRMMLDLIDRRCPRADSTCDEPGITISEAARRELADMGEIAYAWKGKQP